MPQVNSTPGQNQTFGTAAVTSSVAEVGPTASTKAIATATFVTYGQIEPGWHERPGKPTRM